MINGSSINNNERILEISNLIDSDISRRIIHKAVASSSRCVMPTDFNDINKTSILRYKKTIRKYRYSYTNIG